MPQTCETPPGQAGLAKVSLRGSLDNRERTPNPDKNQASSSGAVAGARRPLGCSDAEWAEAQIDAKRLGYPLQPRHAPQPQISELPHHPLAALFPLLDGDEFTALADDIRANGLREPIMLFEGAILDGRNRYRACIVAGVDARFETYNGRAPLAYVISLNLKRRHLDDGQRSFVAAKIETLKHGQRADYAAEMPIGISVTRDDAARMMNVSPRSVARAADVRDHAIPELADK